MNLKTTVHKATIGRWVKRFKEEGHIDVLRKGNCGRLSVIGEETRNMMIEEIQENRNLTARELAKDPILNHNGVSHDTINRMLIENGFWP